MSFWSAVVVIVIVGAISNVLRARYKALESHNQKATHEALPAKDPEAQAELERLRERVKVLERIATDPARRTAEEIESLRDTPD